MGLTLVATISESAPPTLREFSLIEACTEPVLILVVVPQPIPSGQDRVVAVVVSGIDIGLTAKVAFLVLVIIVVVFRDSGAVHTGGGGGGGRGRCYRRDRCNLMRYQQKTYP